MTTSPEQRAEWKAQMQSPQMGDVLNGMLAIAASNNPANADLLRLAGQNLPSIVLGMTNQTPDGPLTLGEWRDRLIEKLQGKPASSRLSAAEQAVETRVEAFRQFATNCKATAEDIDYAVDLVRELATARTQSAASSPEQVYRQVRGLSTVQRIEDGDPTGNYGGQFAVCLDVVQEDEIRTLLELAARTRVGLQARDWNLKSIGRWWLREVRPQQFAFYNIDRLDRFQQLPTEGWCVGPV